MYLTRNCILIHISIMMCKHNSVCININILDNIRKKNNDHALIRNKTDTEIRVILLSSVWLISRGMWCLWHAGALVWRRGPVCACTRVCWCRRIFTYIHTYIRYSYSRYALCVTNCGYYGHKRDPIRIRINLSGGVLGGVGCGVWGWGGVGVILIVWESVSVNECTYCLRVWVFRSCLCVWRVY